MRKTNYDHTLEYMLLFRRIIRAYDEHMAKALADVRLTPNEIATLALIDGKTTTSAIAKRNEVSKALVSRSIKCLSDSGYVTMTQSDVDKRELILTPTESGERLKKLIDLEGERSAAAALKDFDEDRKNALRILLMLVIRGYEGK